MFWILLVTESDSLGRILNMLQFKQIPNNFWDAVIYNMLYNNNNNMDTISYPIIMLYLFWDVKKDPWPLEYGQLLMLSSGLANNSINSQRAITSMDSSAAFSGVTSHPCHMLNDAY